MARGEHQNHRDASAFCICQMAANPCTKPTDIHTCHPHLPSSLTLLLSPKDDIYFIVPLRVEG